jgi:PAS domain S-box-containing protein
MRTLESILTETEDFNSLAEIFRILPVPSMIVLPDAPVFTIVQVNEAYLELTNTTRENLIGRGFLEVFSSNQEFKNENWETLLEQVILEKRPHKTSAIKYESDLQGDPIYLVSSNTPVLNSAGEVEFIVRSVTDVTATVHTQENERIAHANLIRSGKMLEETQRIARVGSWEVNLATSEVTWSEVVRDIHEVGTDFQPSFESALAFYADEDAREGFIKLIEKAIEDGSLFDTQMQILTAKGNDRWIRITGQAEHKDGVNRIFGATQDITEMWQTEQSLIESRNQFESLIQTIRGIVWEADLNTLEFFFVSDHSKDILGFTPTEWLSEPEFWKNRIHPADREETIAYCRRQLQRNRNHTSEYRMIKADGNVVWIKNVVSVIRENGKPVCARGLMVDITEAKRMEELGRLEKSVLEINSSGDTEIQTLLSTYLCGIEEIFPNMHCSIYKVIDNRLRHWLAPSLPEAYCEEVKTVTMGLRAGSCGTAAYLKKTIIVSDIGNDPVWEDYKHLALKYNLRACWSHPIISSSGKVMATFGVYYNEKKEPEEEELNVVNRCASILQIILENRQKSELLEESSFLMKQGEELAHFGNWQWDMVSDVVQWSDGLYSIYGLDKSVATATFEGYLSMIHEDDKERVSGHIQSLIQTGEDVVFEERIIHPNGEIRYLKSWGRVKTDESGNPVMMLGACLDITDSKKIQQQLMESESRLQGIVDAQTNYVMRVDLDGNYTYYNNKYKEDFGWIFEGQEMDGKNVLATVAPTHYESLLTTARDCRANPGKIFQMELDKFSIYGGVRSTYWHLICLTNSKGEPFEIQGIGIDITDRKQAEDALKVSNERYEYVNKATKDAIFDWDIDKDHIQWGEGFARIFGFDNTEEWYPVEKWFANIYPSEKERIEKSLAAALSNTSVNRWEEEYQFRKFFEGFAYVQENAYILRNSQGKAVRMIGVMRDITRVKEEQHHLKMLESVITHANDSVLIAEPDPENKLKMTIRYANEAYVKMSGFSREELIGKDTDVLRGPGKFDYEEGPIADAIKHGLAIQVETIQYKKSGEQYWLSLSLNPIENEKGVVTHWVSIGHDVTERMKYVEAIEQQNEKLKNIAWIQSHVVRAPLARLMGLVDLVKNYENSPSEKDVLLGHILTSANELDGIIRNITNETRTAGGLHS